MTEPVDTNALRVSALDLRTAAQHARRPYRRPYRRFADQLSAAADEVDQLRAELLARNLLIGAHALADAPTIGMQPAKVQVKPNVRTNGAGGD